MTLEQTVLFMTELDVPGALAEELIKRADVVGFSEFRDVGPLRVCVCRVPDSTGVRPTDSGDMAFTGSERRAQYQVPSSRLVARATRVVHWLHSQEVTNDGSQREFQGCVDAGRGQRG